MILKIEPSTTFIVTETVEHERTSLRKQVEWNEVHRKYFANSNHNQRLTHFTELATFDSIFSLFLSYCEHSSSHALKLYPFNWNISSIIIQPSSSIFFYRGSRQTCRGVINLIRYYFNILDSNALSVLVSISLSTEKVWVRWVNLVIMLRIVWLGYTVYMCRYRFFFLLFCTNLVYTLLMENIMVFNMSPKSPIFPKYRIKKKEKGIHTTFLQFMRYAYLFYIRNERHMRSFHQLLCLSSLDIRVFGLIDPLTLRLDHFWSNFILRNFHYF